MLSEINKAIEVLKSGGTILYPTDTVWGIGCDATNEKAVEKVLKIKQRSDAKGFIVLLDNADKLNKYVQDVPAVAWDLIELSDKPLTIIYDKAIHFAPNVINKDGSIAIRIVKDEFCRKLIYKFRNPIVSTSANLNNQATPQYCKEISNDILKAVDYVVNWRQHENTNTKPSSIIKLSANGEIKIIRK